MRKQFLWFAWFICVLVCVENVQAQCFVLGAQVKNEVLVGNRAVPIPEGTWTVVSVHTVKSSSNDEIAQTFLAQLEGNRLARWLNITTNNAYHPGGWARDREICDRKDVHFNYSDSSNNLNDAECWVVNHWGSSLGPRPWQAVVDFYRWSDSHERPNTSLGLAFFFAKHGDFLTVQYSFNPVVAGFKDTPTAEWRGNPWHVDVAGKDMTKIEYLRGLKAIGQDYFAKLRKVLR